MKQFRVTKQCYCLSRLWEEDEIYTGEEAPGKYFEMIGPEQIAEEAQEEARPLRRRRAAVPEEED